MNNYTIVGSEDEPEPKVADFMIEVRGGKAINQVQELIKEEGWEEAAKRVCRKCHSFVPEEEEEDHHCMASYPEHSSFEPQHHIAPI